MGKARHSVLALIATVLFTGAGPEDAARAGAQLVEEQRYAEAIAVLDPAIHSLQREEGADEVALVRLLLPAAKAHAGLEETGEGRAYVDEAFELLVQIASTENADLIVEAFEYRRTTWFDSYDRANRRITQLVSAFELAEKVLDRNDLRLPDMAIALGDEYGQYGMLEQSEEYLRFARLILDRSDTRDPDELGLRLLMLGAAYIRFGDRLEADGLIKEAQALRTSTDGPIAVTRFAPVYPHECRKMMIRGNVTLEFSIDTRGRPHDPRVYNVVTWRGSPENPVENEECEEAMRLAAKSAILEFDYIPELDYGRGLAREGMHTTIHFRME